MDFIFSEDQLALRDLAETVFSTEMSVGRLKEVEGTSDRFDRALWTVLTQAGLTSIAIPEQFGGSGLGMTELCLVLEQQGRRVASTPLLWSSIAALTVAEFGSAELCERLLQAVVAGDMLLTCGLEDAGNVTASRTKGGWVLAGSRSFVPWAHIGSLVLLPAMTDQGGILVIVDPSTPGVTVQRAETTDRQIVSHLEFDGAQCDVVADVGDGERALRWCMERALTGLCALQLGVAEEALAQAATYTTTRLQFGRPLSAFQSVSARAANAFIDTEAIRVTLWQATWRLDEGLDAAVEIDVAKWWASEGGQRVVHTAQLLHGGLGSDIEYPIHRYFLWGKQIELALGGGSARLASLGAALVGGGQSQ